MNARNQSEKKKLEKERTEREIEEACKLYYDADKIIAAEWEAAETTE